jgi:hypothetical protein
MRICVALFSLTHKLVFFVPTLLTISVDIIPIIEALKKNNNLNSICRKDCINLILQSYFELISMNP